MEHRWLWKVNVSTKHASGVPMEGVLWHTHLMLLLMGFSTVSTTLLSCSWRKETTVMSSRLLLTRELLPLHPLHHLSQLMATLMMSPQLPPKTRHRTNPKSHPAMIMILFHATISTSPAAFVLVEDPFDHICNSLVLWLFTKIVLNFLVYVVIHTSPHLIHYIELFSEFC